MSHFFFFLPFVCDKVRINDFPSLPLRPGSTLNYHPGEGLRGGFMSVVLKLEDAFYHCTLSESFVCGCFLLMVWFGCFDVPSFYCLLQSVAQRVSLWPWWRPQADDCGVILVATEQLANAVQVSAWESSRCAKSVKKKKQPRRSQIHGGSAQRLNKESLLEYWEAFFV